MLAPDHRLARNIAALVLGAAVLALAGLWAWRSHARRAAAAPPDAAFVLLPGPAVTA